MTQIIKTDIVYYLEKIYKVLSGRKPAVEVNNITSIDGAILDELQCGDKVVKITGKQKHLYNVSCKGDGVGEGICLTYVDAGTVETVAYDYTVNGWVYNSTDHTTLTPDA